MPFQDLSAPLLISVSWTPLLISVSWTERVQVGVVESCRMEVLWKVHALLLLRHAVRTVCTGENGNRRLQEGSGVAGDGWEAGVRILGSWVFWFCRLMRDRVPAAGDPL